MKKPIITKECAKTLVETKFLNAYDLQYAEGAHYYIATRRNRDTMTCIKTEAEVDTMLADAVTCYIIVHTPDSEPRLLLHYEYRFPIGQYVLCPPAGILDPEDIASDSPLLTGARREIFEETGITITEKDKLRVLKDLVFSTPGFTDECNGLVGADVYLEDTSCLSNKGAEATEVFGDFVLLTKDEAKKMYFSGRDPQGHRYPLYAESALAYFLLREEE